MVRICVRDNDVKTHEKQIINQSSYLHWRPPDKILQHVIKHSVQKSLATSMTNVIKLIICNKIEFIHLALNGCALHRKWYVYWCCVCVLHTFFHMYELFNASFSLTSNEYWIIYVVFWHVGSYIHHSVDKK